MNTRRFNERVAKDRARYLRAQSQRRICAPAHGLLGDATTQKSHRGGGTRLLSLARSIKLKKKGEEAEVRVLAESQAELGLEESYIAVENFSDIQLPIGDYPAGPSNDRSQPSGSFDRHDWEDDDSSSDESEDDFGRVMKDGRRVKYKDYRRRRDRTDKQQRHWKAQLEPGVAAYMEFMRSSYYGSSPSLEDCPTITLTVVDIFSTEQKSIPWVDPLQSTSIIRAGLIPIAPLIHTLALTTHTVMFYHSLFVRCPRLGKQPFVKALCDIEGAPFRLHLSTQLAVAFDVYVSLKNGARERVLQDLGRGARDYRMLNSCPPCQFRLKEDKALPIRMTVGMDGNDSLRRVERRGEAAEVEGTGNEGTVGPSKRAALGPSVERPDARVGGGTYFLSPQEVNAWDEANWETVADLPQGDNLSPMQRLWNEGECEEWWHNAQESNTACAAGNFLECGWFVLLCRHMLLLLACDMIRSGEQSKYPLATLNRFMSAEKIQREETGEGSPVGSLAVSYDISCKFSKTVARSPLKALDQFMCYLPVIGTMHGYGHERACQLLFLMLYIVGAGIEDGEFCERYFSVMNALAAITRHQSIFHRRQLIAEVAYHHDNFEAYAQLSRFIFNNYKQALRVIATKPTLAREMAAEGIASPEIFYEWLEEEGQYLRSLLKTPPVETLEMEYFGKVKALRKCQKQLAKTRQAWIIEYAPDAQDKTTSTETKHRHEQELERKLLADVQAFEEKLKMRRWEKGDANWIRVKAMVRDAEYRRALDKLEGLLVARIFEMARLNVAGTGHKMRKHLSKALKTRSKTIQAAITAYNKAASSFSPPRPTVSWEELMEFSFLGEFDLLRDARDDVRSRKWATQKNRLRMQQFFKIVRAEEELDRLHLEIRRLFTFMACEKEELLARAEAVESVNPPLAFAIQEHWLERGRFDNLHWQRLMSIKKLKGFQRVNTKFFMRGTPAAGIVDVAMEDGDVAGDSRADGPDPAAEGDVADASTIADNASVEVAGTPVSSDNDSSDFDEEDQAEYAETLDTIYSVAVDKE